MNLLEKLDEALENRLDVGKLMNKLIWGSKKEFYEGRIIPKEEWSKDPEKVLEAYETNSN